MTTLFIDSRRQCRAIAARLIRGAAPIIAFALAATPTPLIAAGCWTQVSSAEVHGLAVRNDGTAWAWGMNPYGQLGNGTFNHQPVPGQVVGLENVIAVEGGFRHSVALQSDGTVWSWGDNTHGQLGDGSLISTTTPVQVQGLTGIIAISTYGFHTLALRSDATVWGWGDNRPGVLGSGLTPPDPYVTTPIQALITDVAAIAAGLGHSLALRNDGTVWGWGDNTTQQVGGPPTVGYRTPQHVAGLSGIVAVSCHGQHSLALRSDGTVWAWGANSYGELGNGTTTSTGTPVQVVGLSDVATIAGGLFNSLAVRVDGSVWVWGASSVCSATLQSSPLPILIPGFASIAAAESVNGYNVALDTNGVLWACGDPFLPLGSVVPLAIDPTTCQGCPVESDCNDHDPCTMDACDGDRCVNTCEAIVPAVSALLEPTTTRPPAAPSAASSGCPRSRVVRVVCKVDDNCDSTPTVSAKFVTIRHEVGADNVCREVVTEIDVLCDEVVEIELLTTTCAGAPVAPRPMESSPAESSPAESSPVESSRANGVRVISGEVVTLVVTAEDACYNVGVDTFDANFCGAAGVIQQGAGRPLTIGLVGRSNSTSNRGRR